MCATTANAISPVCYFFMLPTAGRVCHMPYRETQTQKCHVLLIADSLQSLCSSPNASCLWMGCKQTRCDDRMEQIDNRLSTVQTTAAVNMSAPKDWCLSASWHHTAHRLVIVSCYRYLQWFLGNGLNLQKEIFCIFFVKKWMVHFKWSWIHDNRTRNSRRKRQLFY